MSSRPRACPFSLARAQHGKTPKSLAENKGEATHKAIVELLLAAGADKSVADAAGKTAKDDATAAGHEEVAALL